MTKKKLYYRLTIWTPSQQTQYRHASIEVFQLDKPEYTYQDDDPWNDPRQIQHRSLQFETRYQSDDRDFNEWYGAKTTIRGSEPAQIRRVAGLFQRIINAINKLEQYTYYDIDSIDPLDLIAALESLKAERVVHDNRISDFVKYSELGERELTGWIATRKPQHSYNKENEYESISRPELAPDEDTARLKLAEQLGKNTRRTYFIDWVNEGMKVKQLESPYRDAPKPDDYMTVQELLAPTEEQKQKQKENTEYRIAF